MTSETFTKRDGTEVPVPEFKIPPSVVTSLLRLQEDFEARGEHLSLTGVVLHVLDKGVSATRSYWTNSAKQAGIRELGKLVRANLQATGDIADRESILNLARKHGLIKDNGTPREV
jgi:hypothetical protein